MGTWGTGIGDDDTVSDVSDFIVGRLKAGVPLAAASAEALARNRDLQLDEDEAPLLWLAIASMQWKYGTVDKAVLQRVRVDIQSEKGLGRWRDDSADLARRKSALAKFLKKIESPNPKPSPPPKLVVRHSPLAEGDCLGANLFHPCASWSSMAT